MTQTYSIRYPRRRLLRGGARLVGRGLMKVFTRTTVTGTEYLPKKGPLILVGNHVAMIEVALMILHTPWLVEMIGVGDVPLEPAFAPITSAYGFIPIDRGSMDRKGMTMALDVLKQDGVIGIFPEGGIWEANLKEARAGVAWLSSKGNAPIVPMGFGGMAGAIKGMLKLQRPRLTMNIGPVIDPISAHVPGKSRKEALNDGARYVMEQVESLIPEEEKARWPRIIDERFEFKLKALRADGTAVDPPPDLHIPQPEALAKFFHRPMLLNTMAHNLRLRVRALQRLDTEHDPRNIAGAVQIVLDYLQNRPHFLTYRFGQEEGNRMQDGLAGLLAVARWAAESGYALYLQPVRRYRKVDCAEEVVEDRVNSAHSM